ncbi:MAG: hypothetical protein IJZ48_02070 [Oscillospiraceae bacterium]|nr:hypothetical protein [Oscillospiraceae bacterium]
MQGKVEICGVNTARLKVLPQNEMDQLLLQAKNGDENARQQCCSRRIGVLTEVVSPSR